MVSATQNSQAQLIAQSAAVTATGSTSAYTNTVGTQGNVKYVQMSNRTTGTHIYK